MGRIRKASATDKGRMKREDEARRSGKKLSPERGRCIGCVKFSEGAKYVDLGGDVPRLGKLYICSTCVDRCRQVLGYASQNQFESIKQEYEASKEEVKNLRDQVKELEEQVKVLASKTFSDVVKKVTK